MNLPSKLIDDSEDMDLVAQLIIASSEDEEDSATRQAADVVEDGSLGLKCPVCYFNDTRLLRTNICTGRQGHVRPR